MDMAKLGELERGQASSHKKDSSTAGVTRPEAKTNGNSSVQVGTPNHMLRPPAIEQSLSFSDTKRNEPTIIG